MTSFPLPMLVVTRDDSERVQRIVGELQALLPNEPMLQLIDVTGTEDVDPHGSFELVVVLGGDGTILRTCRKLGQRQRPILGVNLGRLGFLAELSPLEFQQHLPLIVRRGYKIIDHLMFECRLLHPDGTVETDVGLNEAAVLSAGSLQLVQIDLAIDGERVATYSGDGLIISTPVGSTAHNLAAGGPILKHDLQAFVITPVCPHTLTIRPLVDRADCVYTLSLPEAADGVMLVVDGQIKRPVYAGDRIEIRRAPVSFQLARLPSCSFYGTLHDKLGWGGQPRYGN